MGNVMSNSHSSFILYRSSFILLAAVLAVGGCQQPYDYYTPTLQAPVPPGMRPPREIEKVLAAGVLRRTAGHALDRNAEDGPAAAVPDRRL